MIGINKMFNLLFNGFCMIRYILFREELLILIIIDFIIFNRTYFRWFILLSIK